MSNSHIVLIADHCSDLVWSTQNYAALSAENISTAFRAAVVPGEGGFVGPVARITRRSFAREVASSGTLPSCAVQTSAVWLYEVPPPQGLAPAQWRATICNALAERIYARLNERANNGGVWTVSCSPYSEGINGSIAQWLSGQASSTRTRNAPDAGTEENKVGPDSAPMFQRRTELSGVLERGVNRFAVGVVAAGAIVGIGALAYFLYKKSNTVGVSYYPYVSNSLPVTSPPAGTQNWGHHGGRWGLGADPARYHIEE